MRGPLLFCLACAIQLVAAATPTSAIPTDWPGSPVDLAEVRGGMLLYLDEEQCQLLPAPSLETDVEIEVTGIISRTRVRQQFHNPTDEWLEGVYVFPLPTGAAIDGMRLIVGNRVIEGEIQERAEAKKTYEAAKKAGHKTSLLEQERPNIFTISVANIGPGEQVSVEIRYQENLVYLDGSFSLRFPLVVLPRYIPGTTPVAGAAGTGWAGNTDQVPDAARITPPVVHPSEGPINPVRLHVDLNAGFPLAEVLSPSHSIRAKKDTPGRYRVELREGEVPADRDFVLNWRPTIGSAPTAALFTQEHEGDQYLLLMVMPPQVEEEGPAQTRIPRETIFVIDTSGSMSGISITQAREALKLALRQLHPGDSFNVIQFNSATSSLFRTSEDVTPATLRQAFSYVEGLRAQGGTEMLPALEAALDDRRPSASRLRQVIFMTDGSVGNEPQLFGHIDRHLGSSRLFTVGIGSAPNSFFMRRAAQFGRGTFTYIGTVGEVEEKMGTLFRQLETPLLRDVELQWTEWNVEVWPERLPDLYAGQPLVISARMRGSAGEVTVRGERRDRPWEVTLPIAFDEESTGIDKLWARRKIAALMDHQYRGGDPKETRQGVVELALRHHLLSSFTSLVAVDRTPAESRPAEQTLAERAVPTNLAHGCSFDHFFGRLPQTATPARLYFLLGLAGLAGALLVGRLARGRAT